MNQSSKLAIVLKTQVIEIGVGLLKIISQDYQTCAFHQYHLLSVKIISQYIEIQ